MPYFLGVDVGTASVRAGIFDEIGQLHGQDVQPIQVNLLKEKKAIWKFLTTKNHP